jgi:hypothetical protein
MILVAAVLAAQALAQAPPTNMSFRTTLKSVSVFRDGFGYYVREGKVKLENGWATTDLVPAAIKGTVWFYSKDPGDKIDSVVMSRENRIEFASPSEIKGKLADKLGLRLVVNTSGGQRFEGELAKILDDMLLIRVGDAFSAVPYAQIRSVAFAGFPTRIKVTAKDPNKVVTIGVAYLQEGIRWEPSYILDIQKGGANLSLRATMQNTTERLASTDVFFVVGSPFVSNRGISDLLAQAPGAAIGEAPVMASRTAGAFGMPAGGPAAPMALDRGEAGELYYYRKSDLSLDTSDLAMVSIFDATVPVVPRFEWNADGEEVTYLLSITNKSGQPLTTGPVFVLEGGRALGQETIRYTPAGGTAEVRLSRGIGLKVVKTEAEVKRAAPTKVGKTEFIPVTLKGTLTITNFRTEAATVKVTKSLRGKVGVLSDGGVIKQTQVLNGEPNPLNDLEWSVSVAPGATKTITYSYETYMSAERAGGPPLPDGDQDRTRR